MKTSGKMGSIFGLLICLCSFSLYGFGNVKELMGRDLDFIKSLIETKYAPLEWKGAYAGVVLDDEVATAKAKIESLSHPTTKDFQVILRSFFNSMKDYHVGVNFYSTESAYLPFTIKGAQGRYFISHIDHSQLTPFALQCEVGDEVLAIDHQPMHLVIAKLKRDELGSNTPETDQRLAELLLTMRKGEEGHRVPQGKVIFTVKSKKTDEEKQYPLTWAYTPQKISDFSENFSIKTFAFPSLKAFLPQEPSLKELVKNIFEKYMVTPSFLKGGIDVSGNPNLVGARKSYLPRLGEVLWQSGNNFTFDAYIFAAEGDKRIGYIRIPHYMGDTQEAFDFQRLVNLFESNTDALVIDQVNNPGGSIFYLYGLASMLTEKPLYAPKHRIAITQKEVFSAVTLLPLLERVKSGAAAREALGDSVGGYPVTFETIILMKKFCQFLISEWNAGHLLTAPTHIFGVDTVNPHPQTKYTKPIVLLINSLDFSGGDFFPAILKDGERAVIVGTRTAGAGGYVLPNEYANRFGVQDFNLTGSIALRKDQMPLENLGVEPDVLYELTVRDLQENYVDYVNFILKTLDSVTSGN